MDLDNVACFRCGKYGHLKANCPSRTPPGSEDLPPRSPEAHAAHNWQPPPVPARKPPGEIADAEAWANHVRTSFGWSAGQQERTKQQRALAQVVQARQDRYADLF